MKKTIIGLILFFVSSISVEAQKSEVFTASGKAISGYDPVAYFTKSKAILGNSQFIHSWRGSDWHFISADNLKTFKDNPEKYAPQYGGYCAYGMANGYKAPTDKDAWTIVRGKLYLNYNKDVQKLWNEKQSEYILTADKNWPAKKNK